MSTAEIGRVKKMPTPASDRPERLLHKVAASLSEIPELAPELVARVRAAAKALGLSHRDIVSGAAHDAVYLSRVAPSAMIFVPCEGGISHNEIENARPDDCAAGCSVLLQAALATAGA